MNRIDKSKEVKNYLMELERNIEYETCANLFDINKHCENFYCGLLNIIYGYDLKNINAEVKGFTAVDLIDDKNGIYIQVTSDNSTDKVQTTIDKFIKTGFYKKGKLLLLIISGKKKKYRKSFNTQGKFTFNSSKDIIDNRDLLFKISNLPIDQINQVLKYLKSELDSKYTFINPDSYEKVPKIETNFFSNRLVCKASDYKEDKYFSKYKALQIETVLKDNNRIVIIGDAGTGKSEMCKNIVNTINDSKRGFAFYYNLLNYTGGPIENLKPNIYADLPNEFITFVLDGYDEIISNQKNMFLKNIQNFISQNERTKVIITSRTNFYKAENNNSTIDNFESYYLLDFDEDNIRELAINYDVNYDNLMLDIRKNGLSSTMENPFYANFLIEYYAKHNCLLKKEELIEKIIYESFENDTRKFKTTENLEDSKEKIFKILKLLSFSMAILERNYLTKKEFLKLIKKEDIELLNYSSLWKNEDDKLMFSHNNFFEYLAAEKLLELNYDEIKKLITYDGVTFNPKWMNIVVFMINKKYDHSFVDWLLNICPDFIFYLEKDKISDNRREQLFISTFKSYEEKKIWLPGKSYYNDRFADFIYSENVIEYLVSKLDSTNHYTVIYNSLNLLSQFKSYGKSSVKLKNILIKMACSDEVNTSQKRMALNILSDKKMIDDAKLDEIIKINQKHEDAYLRAAYYYYLNKNGINENNIDILFKRFDNSGLKNAPKYVDDEDESDNDVVLADEYLEFDKLFANIKDINLLIKLFERLIEAIEVGNVDFLSNDVTKNVCYSIEQFGIEKEQKLDLYLKLYLIIEKNCDNKDLKIFADFLSTKNLNLELFKKLLDSGENIDYFGLNYLINDECLEYFYSQYNMGYCDDKMAREILSVASDTDSIFYTQINGLYFKRTNHNFIEERKIDCKKEKGKRIQDYFDSIFDKNVFFTNLQEYLSHLNLKNPSRIERSEIKKIDYEFYDTNDKYNCIISFLRCFDRKKDYILLSDLEKIDWDRFILAESYNMLKSYKEISVSTSQREKINSICQQHLKEMSFRDTIKYNNDGSFTTSNLSIYLWSMRHMLNLQYPENVLLDMLSFDWICTNHNYVGIDYIIDAVSEDKVKNRIIDNIKNRKMLGAVLKNHVKYCIKHEIDDLSEYLIKYLKNNKIKYFYKTEIVEYILKFYPIELIKNNLLDVVDFDTRIGLIDGIYKINKCAILNYIEVKSNNVKNLDKKIIYLKYLIKSSNLNGISKYYELLKKEMRCVDIKNIYKDAVKDALSQVDSIECLDIIAKIYLLTFSPKFKDNRFYSVHSGCIDAFIKMALSNIQNNSHIKVIEKLKNIINENKDIDDIGFTYNIIDEIKSRFCFETKNQYDIEQVAKMVNNLFKKVEFQGLMY